MKKSIPFNSILFCLLGFFLQSQLHAHDIISLSPELSKTNTVVAASFAIPPPQCNTPTWPTTTNITQTSATFSWDYVPGALNYTVQVRIQYGTWYDVPGSPTSMTSITATGLSSNTTYEWHVRSNCSGGQYSYWTASIPFTTLGSSCNAPTWLSTTNITQTTATFSWSSCNGAQSYSIQWRLANGTWYNLNGGPFTNTWVNVGGFQPATAYEWRVRSNCAYGQYSPWSYPAAFTTLGYSCNTPTWPTTTNVTQSTASFSWDNVPGAVNYTVQLRLPYGTWYDLAGSPFSGTSATATGLSPSTTYEWRVRANCSGGQYSYWTSPISFTTLGASCNAPAWLSTTNITQTTATFSWASCNGAQSYSVQWRLAGGNWYDLSGGPWTNTWINVGGFQPGTSYEWRVRSNCGYGQYSPWSYPASFTTLNYSCTTPTWPTTTNVTQTSASFSWDNVPGAQSYTVQTRLLNGTWYDIPGSPTYNTYATVNGLSPNTTYQWRVRANCGNGQYSYWTEPITFTTLGASCNAPTWLYTTNVTQNSATLHWSTCNGASSYNLQWRLPGGYWYDVPGGPWTNTWYNLTGLQACTTYEWRVQSNCYNGYTSDWSGISSFTTSCYSCNTPTWPITTNVTQTSASFSWDNVPGAQSYTVQTRLLNGTWYDIPGSPTYNTYATINGLSPNTTYQWRVRANCGNGQYSYWTSPITFTTYGSSCEAPGWLFTTNITQTSATLNWDLVYGASSYSIQWRLAGGNWYDLAGGPWTGSWHTITGLQPGTNYEWRIKSNCYNGDMSPWSYPEPFTTLGYACSTPTWPMTSNITETSATFSWDVVPGAQNYTVQTRLLNGTWYDVPGGPFAGTTVTVYGLTPNTTYQWRVRANCGNGQYSYWTSPITFTTIGQAPANNNCVNATLLTVNSTCMNTAGSNQGATPSVPPPSGECWSYNYKDVWFRFVMPGGNSPTVTIRTTAGSMDDAVMEVYVGNDCSSLSFLSCEDDNSNGNGSTMPVINLIGYPGAMIWVRIWGYSGETGTFSICVLDYQSNNFAGDDKSSFVPVIGNQLDPLQIESNVNNNREANTVTPVVHIAPNPASDILNVSLSQTDDCTVSGIVMYDLSGKAVLEKEYQSNGTKEFRDELNVSGWVPGIYILQIRTTTGVITEKVSVIRN